MTTGYVDDNLIQNSTLACFLLTIFVRKYEELTAGTSSPELTKLLLVLPATWNKESCNAIKSRNFSTSLHTVLADSPGITHQFKERLTAFTPVSCQGLNLACATGLLRVVSINSTRCIAVESKRWPRGSKPTSVPSEMIQAAERLASWFKDAQAARLYSQFLGI